MEKVTEVLKGASEKVKETFHHAGEIGSDIKDKIVGKAKDVDMEEVEDKVKDTTHDAIEKSAEIKDNIVDKAKEIDVKKVGENVKSSTASGVDKIEKLIAPEEPEYD